MLPERLRNRGVEGSVIDENDYQDYARYYEEYDDDEEVADYYFSSAAGRARISIGNRRHGPNGFMSSGRMRARPTPPPPQGKVSLPKLQALTLAAVFMESNGGGRASMQPCLS